MRARSRWSPTEAVQLEAVQLEAVQFEVVQFEVVQFEAVSPIVVERSFDGGRL
jgi:hypothetical protein